MEPSSYGGVHSRTLQLPFEAHGIAFILCPLSSHLDLPALTVRDGASVVCNRFTYSMGAPR